MRTVSFRKRATIARSARISFWHNTASPVKLYTVWLGTLPAIAVALLLNTFSVMAKSWIYNDGVDYVLIYERAAWQPPTWFTWTPSNGTILNGSTCPLTITNRRANSLNCCRQPVQYWSRLISQSIKSIWSSTTANVRNRLIRKNVAEPFSKRSSFV